MSKQAPHTTIKQAARERIESRSRHKRKGTSRRGLNKLETLAVINAAIDLCYPYLIGNGSRDMASEMIACNLARTLKKAGRLALIETNRFTRLLDAADALFNTPERKGSIEATFRLGGQPAVKALLADLLKDLDAKANGARASR